MREKVEKGHRLSADTTPLYRRALGICGFGIHEVGVCWNPLPTCTKGQLCSQHLGEKGRGFVYSLVSGLELGQVGIE